MCKLHGKRIKTEFVIGGVLLLLFCLFTVGVKTIDVKPIGPQETAVGFSGVNGFFAEVFGQNMLWYDITDWLGVVAVFTAFGFAVWGLVQAIKRKSVIKADADILILGAYYIVVIAVYVLFELCIVNYRPVIISSGLEASYPSSHTVIVCCIMAAAIEQFNRRISAAKPRIVVCVLCCAVMTVTVVGRVVSGVHWFTDIVGGLILSAGLFSLYLAAVDMTKKTE